MGNCCTSRTQNADVQAALDGVREFSLDELRQATHNFSETLGIGGLAIVYSGWVDEDPLAPLATRSEIQVAVKKYLRKNPEGLGATHWLTEKRYLAQLEHPNIINLVGFCCDSGEHMLIYDYMPNGSMEKLLFAAQDRLHWQLRFRALLGAAKGLKHLHNQTPKVIYRDFKPSNILLDQNHNGVLADFGIARDGPTGDGTHVTTGATGTFGYICPYYIMKGKLTTKADVYSFGVVILEVLSGRATFDPSRPHREQILIKWALPDIKLGRFPHHFLDIEIVHNCPNNKLVHLRELARRCLEDDPIHRPSMNDVVTVLELVTDME